jgi:hypothetical protein
MRFGMKNNLKLVSATFLAIFLVLSLAPANAQDIPLLTWEKGKVQSVVLGGGETSKSWKVYLKSQENSVTELSSSTANTNGFIVYSLNVPRDLATGAYSIVTKGDVGPETLVAAVQIIEMQRYEITKIPGDLLFILLALALWFTALSALRGDPYRKVSLLYSTGPKERYLNGEPSEDYIEYVHKFVPFEKLRIQIYEQIPESFFKVLLKSDSKGLHSHLPWVWAILPGLTLLLGGYFGFKTRNMSVFDISGYVVALLIAITFLGSLDIFSGLVSAVSFFAIRVWLFPEFSVSVVMSTISLSLLFFLPALISAYFSSLVAGKIKGQMSNSITNFIFNWVSPFVMVHYIFLIYRSINGSTQPSFSLEVLLISAIWAARFIESILSTQRFSARAKVSAVEQVDLNIGRLVSPASAAATYLFVSILMYIWTAKGLISLGLAALICVPLFLLQIRPTAPWLYVFNKLKRNHLVEILLSVSAVFAVLKLLEKFPVIAGSRPALFISLGFLPVIIHSMISFVSDSGSNPKLSEDNK